MVSDIPAGDRKNYKVFFSVVAFVSKACVCKITGIYVKGVDQKRGALLYNVHTRTCCLHLTFTCLLPGSGSPTGSKVIPHFRLVAEHPYISLSLVFLFYISFDRTAGTHSWPLSIGQHTKWMHLKWTSFFLLFGLVLALPWTGVGLVLALSWHGLRLVLDWCWPGVGLVLAWYWPVVGLVLTLCWPGVGLVLDWC